MSFRATNHPVDVSFAVENGCLAITLSGDNGSEWSVVLTAEDSRKAERQIEQGRISDFLVPVINATIDKVKRDSRARGW